MTSIEDGWECPFSGKPPAPACHACKKTKSKRILEKVFLCVAHRDVSLEKSKPALSIPAVSQTSPIWSFSSTLLSNTSLEHLNSSAALRTAVLELTITSSKKPIPHEGIHIRAGWRTTIAFSEENVFTSL